MATVFVRFSDKAETKIVTVFASPADPDCYQFLGEVDESDGRLKSFWMQFQQHELETIK